MEQAFIRLAEDPRAVRAVSNRLIESGAGCSDLDFLKLRVRGVTSPLSRFAATFTNNAIEGFRRIAGNDVNGSQLNRYSQIAKAATGYVAKLYEMLRNHAGVEREVSVVVAVAGGRNAVLIRGREALIVVDYYQFLKASLFACFALRGRPYTSVLAAEVLVHSAAWSACPLPLCPRLWEIASDVDPPRLRQVNSDILFYIIAHEMAHALELDSEGSGQDGSPQAREHAADLIAWMGRDLWASVHGGEDFARDKLRARVATLALAYYCWDCGFLSDQVHVSDPDYEGGRLVPPDYADTAHPPWLARMRKLLAEAAGSPNAVIVTDHLDAALRHLWGDEVTTLAMTYVWSMQAGKRHAGDPSMSEWERGVRALCKGQVDAHPAAAKRWYCFFGLSVGHWYLDHLASLRVPVELKERVLDEKLSAYLTDPQLNNFVAGSDRFTVAAVSEAIRAVGTDLRRYAEGAE